MPLPGGHYRSNISNPFNNFQPAQATHTGPYHHSTGPSVSFHSQAAQQHAHNGPPGGFASAAHQNGNSNINLSLFGGGAAGGAAGLTNGAGAAFANGAGTGLGSHEAQMGFERGAALQRQHQQQTQQQPQGPGQTAELLGAAAAAAAGTGAGLGRGQGRIREVWAGNLEQEMDLIRTLVLKYPCVSMDTEFPGIVARPIGNFPTKSDYHYQCLRCNVDLLKLIQLGITLFSPDGDTPPTTAENLPLTQHSKTHPFNNSSSTLTRCPCTWTFNFKFSLASDMYSADSIQLLQKAGVDFQKNEVQGIDPNTFASLLITSGLVLDDSISWLSFHSGYDFGYLIKIVTNSPLPPGEEDYLSLVRTWFPRVYDIKFLLRNAQARAAKGIMGTSATDTLSLIGPRSSLSDIAESLGLGREGRAHTAGSDAWLTGQVFWHLRRKVFDDAIPADLIGMIWGISAVGPPASAASQAAAIAGTSSHHAATGSQGQGTHTPVANGAQLFHTGMTPSTHTTSSSGGGGGRDTSALPATPQSSGQIAGLAGTPGLHAAFGQGQGGGGGGAFGAFGYGR